MTTPHAHTLSPTAAQRAALSAAPTTPSGDNPFVTQADVLPSRFIELTFTETAGDGVYTGTVAIPAGATVVDVIFRNSVLWNAGTSASLTVGDDDDADGYIAATNVKAAPSADTAGGGQGISTRLSLGATAGAYKGGGGKYCAIAKTITATITKVGSGTAGRSRLLVEYTLPASSAIAKV